LISHLKGYTVIYTDGVKPQASENVVTVSLPASSVSSFEDTLLTHVLTVVHSLRSS
jgi:hypothetical protein